MNKPTGVILIAILDFIGTALLGCLGLLAFVAMGFLATMISQAANGQVPPQLIAGVGIFLGIVCFFFAAVAALVGYGMWSLKEWARIVQMVFAALGVLGGAIGLLLAIVHFSIFGFTLTGIRLAINLAILWYLNQPQVKAAFQARAAAAPAR